ncbi:cupin domain-containing protein [bacterium]|nr:cupin domain-containing protein [bacterium]MBU1638585.1 cupin domain-containing protein [bacterium]
MSEHFSLKKHIDYSTDSIVSKIVLKKEAGTVTLFAFDKDQELSEHTAPFDAVVQIIAGEAHFIIDGESKDVKEGELIIMPAGAPHSVKAEHRFKMLLTMIKSESDHRAD